MQRILNRWIQRDITLFGRALLTKMDSLSGLIYPAASPHILGSFIKAINRIHFNVLDFEKIEEIEKSNSGSIVVYR